VAKTTAHLACADAHCAGGGGSSSPKQGFANVLGIVSV